MPHFHVTYFLHIHWQDGGETLWPGSGAEFAIWRASFYPLGLWEVPHQVPSTHDVGPHQWSWALLSGIKELLFITHRCSELALLLRPAPCGRSDRSGQLMLWNMAGVSGQGFGCNTRLSLCSLLGEDGCIGSILSFLELKRPVYSSFYLHEVHFQEEFLILSCRIGSVFKSHCSTVVVSKSLQSTVGWGPSAANRETTGER